mgnify:CR=1 FL=1
MRRLRKERQYVLRQRKKYFEIAQFNNNTTTTIDLHLDACNCRSYCAARVRHRQHSPNSLSLSIAIVGVWGVPCRDPGVPCLDPGVFPGIGLPTGVDAALKASSRAFVRDRKRSIRAPASAASSAFRVNFSRSVWRLAIDSFHRASRSTTCFLIFSRLCSFFSFSACHCICWWEGALSSARDTFAMLLRRAVVLSPFEDTSAGTALDAVTACGDPGGCRVRRGDVTVVAAAGARPHQKSSSSSASAASRRRHRRRHRDP